jgi:polar amino acid transport system substrate-binding protein
MNPATPAAEIAPHGKLRAATIVVHVMRGVAEPLGRFIAEALGVPFEFIVYPNPAAYEQSFGTGAWDIALGPRVLASADKADLTADVWLVDLMYVAAAGKSFAAAADVDRAGTKIGTIRNSPSDRFLTHGLKAAEPVRIALSDNFPADAIDLLRNGKADVFGADSGLIDAIVGAYPDAKRIPGAFHTVRAAAALPKGRSPQAQAKLAEIVAAAKRAGAVANAIEHAGLKNGVRVAL